MLASRVPANHMVVFGALEEAWEGSGVAEVERNCKRKCALTHIVLSKRWPVAWCLFLSCCFAVVAAVGSAGAGSGAAVEAVASAQPSQILAVNCDSRYHPGRNGKKKGDEEGTRLRGTRDDIVVEVESLEDGGDMKTGVDMNLLEIDWDKGRPWAGRTEQDVGTEWLRRLDCTKRSRRMWSDRERAARGEGNVIPGAGGRSSLGWVTRRLNIM